MTPVGLPRLIATDPATFAAQHWGRAPLLSPAEQLPGPFDDLLCSDAVDELVSQRGLRVPFLRVAKDGVTLRDAAFTSGGGVGAAVADQVTDDKLAALFAAGATMVLQGLHRVWPPLTAFAQSLAADLGHPVQVNAYVTPPLSTGFSDHYDVHDVFVLQVEGEKRWRIHDPVRQAPLRDEPWTDRRAQVEAAAGAAPLLDVVLRPGDCLYLPRGYLHAATALGGVSLHLTVGVHTWTRHSVAREMAALALDQLVEDVELRRSLPLGTRVGEPAVVAGEVEQVRAALVDALGRLDADDVARRMAVRARAAQRAAPLGPLAQLRTASELDADTLLVLREHLAATLVPGGGADGGADGGGGSVLRSRAGDVPLAPSEVDGARRCLAGRPVTVADLGPDLARRLVAAGVLVAVDSG